QPLQRLHRVTLPEGGDAPQLRRQQHPAGEVEALLGLRLALLRPLPQALGAPLLPLGLVAFALGHVALGLYLPGEVEAAAEEGEHSRRAPRQHRRRRRPAFHPLASLLDDSRRAGADRLSRLEAPQILREVRRAGVAPRRLLLQASQADDL